MTKRKTGTDHHLDAMLTKQRIEQLTGLTNVNWKAVLGLHYKPYAARVFAGQKVDPELVQHAKEWADKYEKHLQENN